MVDCENWKHHLRCIETIGEGMGQWLAAPHRCLKAMVAKVHVSGMMSNKLPKFAELRTFR